MSNYGEPNNESISMCPFARKNLLQHGFIVGMKFAGFDKNTLDLSKEEDKERYEQMCEAIMDIFESHGLTREIEFQEMIIMKNIAMLPVRCISIRESNPTQIVIDQEYVIDRLTIWIDADGDACGTVYDNAGNRIGDMLLKHFRCLQWRNEMQF